MPRKGYHDIFPMEEYYERIIEPMDRMYKYKRGNKRVCPFHHDKAPSMGILLNQDGSEIFHCFGCGKKGNIVMMHKYMEQQYHNRTISDNQAKKELCDLFRIDYKQFAKESQEEELKAAKDTLRFYDNTNGEIMTDRKFAEKVLEGKKTYKDVKYYNGLLIQLIDAKNKEQEGK